MSLNDSAVLLPATVTYYTAPVGTTLPTTLSAPPVTWESIGHTTLDELLSTESDGGDVTILSTLQARSLRSARSARTDKFVVKAHQFDASTLRLFYGANAPTNPDGTIGAPSTPTPTLRAFLAVVQDAVSIFAIYAPKAEILGSDVMDLSDTQALGYLPLGITPVSYNGSTAPYSVTPIGLNKGAAKPGDTFPTEATVTASDSTNAAKLAALGYVALPSTAWTTGQQLTIGGFAFNWSGTAWAAGAHA